MRWQKYWIFSFKTILNNKLRLLYSTFISDETLFGGNLSWWECAANRLYCRDHFYNYDHRDRQDHCDLLDHYHHLKNVGSTDTWWNFIISETVFMMMRNKIRFSKGADVTRRHI